MYEGIIGSFGNTCSTALDRLPVSIWIENWSPVKVMIDELAHDGTMDWRRYFEYRPDMIIRAADTIDVIDINAATLDLYRAKRKEDVIDSTLGEKMSGGEMTAFREQLAAFAGGDMHFTIDAQERTMDEMEIHTRIRAGIVPERRDDWSVVYCIVEEISKRRQTDAANLADRISNDDLVYWQMIKDSGDSEDYEAYLETFPEGLFAPLARKRTTRLVEAAMTGELLSPAPCGSLAGLDFKQLDESARKNTERLERFKID